MKPVGYLVKHPEGLEGERGMYYDYVLASNGLFIEAEGKLMAARVPVAFGEVRGLVPLEPKVVLRYGRIPQRFFDLAMSTFLADKSKERYVAVTWNEEYHIIVPEQAENKEELEQGVDKGHGCGAGVSYLNPDSVMLDLHSHGKMPAFFSLQDNQDEKGMKLYGVVGKLDETPIVKLRVGVYGYFHPVSWGDSFDGYLNGVQEYEEQEEVIGEDELQGIAGEPEGWLESCGRRLWGHRWFCRRGTVPIIRG